MTRVDSMQDMDISTDWDHGLEPRAIITLGVRAAWLHMALSSPSVDAMAPRDREILTLVATRPTGVGSPELAGVLRLHGMTHSAALHWIDRLIAQGWLSRSGDPTHGTVDLATGDLEWITDQVNRISQALR